MNRQTVGIFGCVAVILAILIGGAPWFLGRAFQSAEASHYIGPCWWGGLVLFIVGTVYGMKSWATLPGKVATIAGLVLGILLAMLLFYANFIFSLKM